MSEFIGDPLDQGPIPIPGENPNGDYVAVPRGMLQGMLNETAGLRERVTSLGEQVAYLEKTLGALLLNGASVEPPTTAKTLVSVKANAPQSTDRYKIVPPILPARRDAEATASLEAHEARDSLGQTLDEVMQALQISASITLDNPPEGSVQINPPKKRLLRPSRTTPVGPEKASWTVNYEGHTYGFGMERTKTNDGEKDIRFSMTKYGSDTDTRFSVTLDAPNPNSRRLTLGWNLGWSKVGHVSEMEQIIGELLPDTSDIPEGAKLFDSLKHGNHNLAVTFKPHNDGGVELSLNSRKSSGRAQSLSYNLQGRCFQNRGNNPYGHSYYDQDIPAEAARQLIEMAHKLVPSLEK